MKAEVLVSNNEIIKSQRFLMNSWIFQTVFSLPYQIFRIVKLMNIHKWLQKVNDDISTTPVDTRYSVMVIKR